MAENLRSRLILDAENRTKQAFGEVKRSIAEVEGSIGRFNTVLAGLGAGLSAGGLAAIVKSAIDSADQLNKMSQKVGVSVESLSELGYAAGLADVSLEALGTGLKRLSVAMQETQAGTGEARNAFRALGISVEASKGALKSSEQVLFEIADSFAGMEDSAGKTALAMKLFGKAGADLIPLLNLGSKGLKENAEEARRFGLVISTEAAKKAEEFNDNLRRVSESLRGFGIGIANEALPWLNKMVEQLLEGTRIAGGFANALRLFGFSTITSDTAGEKIREITASIEKLTAARKAAEAAPSGFRSKQQLVALDAQIADAKKQLEFAKFLQRQTALELGRAAGGDTPGEQARTRVPKVKAPGLPDDKAIADAKRVMQKYASTLAQLRQDLIPEELRSSEVIKIRFAIENDEQLKQLAPALKEELLDAAAVVDQVRDIARADKEREQGLAQIAQEVTKQSNEEIEQRAKVKRAILDLIDPIQKYRDEIAKVEKALELGDITPTQAAAALAFWHDQIEAAQGLSQQVDKTADEMTEFMREAARGMQNAMSDFFFDVMQGEFDDLAGNFKKTLDRMVADILAAKLAEKLFGKDFGKGGDIGGIVGDIVGAIKGAGTPSQVLQGPTQTGGNLSDSSGSLVTSIIGSISSGFSGVANFFKGIFGFAAGGDVPTGVPILVGEEGPEIIVPRGPSTVVPNGATSGPSFNIAIALTNNFAGAVDPRAPRQIAAEVGRQIQESMRRYG